MTGACSRYNANSDWLSAGALVSRNTHKLITNYAKTKGNLKAHCFLFFFPKIEFYCPDELEFQETSEGTGLNYQRVGARQTKETAAIIETFIRPIQLTSY